MSLPHLLFSVLALTAASASQTGLPWIGAGPGSPVDREIRPLPPLPGHTSFLRAVPARLTGHVVPDVLVLDGDRLLLFTAPDIHASHGPLPGLTDAVLDFAPLRQGSAMNPHQPVAIVGHAGLDLWQMNSDSATPQLTHVDDPAWNGARHLAAHPDDGSVLYGIAADERTLLVAQVQDGVLEPAHQIGLGAPALAIACIDWDRDGLAEVGVLRADGLQIFDRSGASQPLDAFHEAVAVPQLQLVRSVDPDDAPQEEWLCFLTTDGTDQTIGVRSGNTAASVPCGPTAYVALAAGDFTLDGKDELLLSTAENVAVSVLLNLAGSWPDVFAHNGAVAVSVQVADPSASRAANACGVAVVDLDGDTDCDLLTPVESETGDGGSGPALAIMRPHFASHTPLATFVDTLYLDPELLLETAPEYGLIPADKVRFDFGVEHVPGATHYEVVVWRVGSTELVPTAVLHERFAEADMPESRRVWIELDKAHLDAQGAFAAMLRPIVVEDDEVTVAGVASLALLQKPAVVVPLWPRGGVVVGGSTPSRPLPPGPEEPPPSPSPGN